MGETEDTTPDDDTTIITDENTPLLGEEHEDHLLSSDTTRSYKTRNRLSFAAFALIYFTMSASYSVIAPFYPNEENIIARIKYPVEKQCLLCNANSVDTIFLPSFHLKACQGCAKKLVKCCSCEVILTEKEVIYVEKCGKLFHDSCKIRKFSLPSCHHAKEKGASGEEVGLIFGAFALVTFFASPVFGALMPIIGLRFLLFSGMFVIGVAEFLFGFINRMPNGAMFITYSFILRGFDGLGGAAAYTAAVAYLAQCFPDNIGTVMGGLELFTGIGITTGPLLGGVLYEYGGFGMPFFVLAGLMLVTLPIIMCILPPIHQASLPLNEENEGTTNAVTIMKVLKIPAFDIVGGAVIVGGMAIGIVEPALAPHLRSQFNITSSTKIGLLFFMLSAAYALFAPLFGWVADKTNPRWVMTFGCFCCAFGFFLLGPVPFSFMPNELWLVCVSLAIIGLSLGPLFVPAISEMENIAKARNYPDTLATHGIISGVYGSAFNIGAFIGPTLSGVFTEYVHFNWTCTGFGVILLIQATLLLILALSDSSTKITKTKKTEAPSPANQGNTSVPSSDNPRTIQA